ncbi:hypothetical protein KJS94_02090 [Flavihumibacter rivuli]|uniref:hypothetical protein n=1 Tax=Flavihumibacter rivuli TaxID=2838156 RepID=UPI001BDEC557|nr:hypothetical protein [Flavihumibacter rivuli]ULQ56985.1 hypothetical protein KJS94_02090 [Flavihumibacter rivuli]
MPTLRTVLLAAIRNVLLIWGLFIIALVFFSGDLSVDRQFYLYIFGLALVCIHFVVRDRIWHRKFAS